MIFDEADLQRVRAVIAQNTSFAILTHISPDGDAIGSALGLALALRAAGKQAVAVCADPPLAACAFLPEVTSCLQAIPEGYVCISVDAADFRRLGKLGSQLKDRTVAINIDHHVSNTRFGEINLIDPDAAATGAYLVELLPLFGLPITTDVATCLLTGIVTDTLGFRTPSTTQKTLASVMQLIQTGANLQQVIDLMLNRRDLSVLRLWGHVLQRATLANGLVWSAVTLADRATVGYALSDDGDVVNMLATVNDADVVVLFVEHPNQHVKISWRSRNGFDVAALAVACGGGGHKAAAGANLNNTSLAEAYERVLPQTQTALAAFLAAAAVA